MVWKQGHVSFAFGFLDKRRHQDPSQVTGELLLFPETGEADRLGWKAMPFARDDLDSNCAQG